MLLYTMNRHDFRSSLQPVPCQSKAVTISSGRDSGHPALFSIKCSSGLSLLSPLLSPPLLIPLLIFIYLYPHPLRTQSQSSPLQIGKRSDSLISEPYSPVHRHVERTPFHGFANAPHPDAGHTEDHPLGQATRCVSLNLQQSRKESPPCKLLTLLDAPTLHSASPRLQTWICSTYAQA